MLSVGLSAAFKSVVSYKLKNLMGYTVVFYCSIFLKIDNVSNLVQWKKMRVFPELQHCQTA